MKLDKKEEEWLLEDGEHFERCPFCGNEDVCMDIFAIGEMISSFEPEQSVINHVFCGRCEIVMRDVMNSYKYKERADFGADQAKWLLEKWNRRDKRILDEFEKGVI